MTPQEYLEQVRQLALQRVPNSFGIRTASIHYVTNIHQVMDEDRAGVSAGKIQATTQTSYFDFSSRIWYYAIAFWDNKLHPSVVMLHELAHAHRGGLKDIGAGHGPRWADACGRIGLIVRPYRDDAPHSTELFSAHPDAAMQAALDKIGPFPADPAVEAEIRKLKQGFSGVGNPDPWQELMDSLKGREVNADLWRAINGTGK